MSRSDDGKCPDNGKWCGVIRDICDGDCYVREDERRYAEMESLRVKCEAMMKAYEEWGVLQDAVGQFIDEQNAVTLSELCRALGRSICVRRDVSRVVG